MTPPWLHAADDAARNLYARAEAMREHAWAPYSRFTVGAIIEDEHGECVAGVNVENASYGLTLCAERVAAGQGRVAQLGRWRRVAIASPPPGASPCGACRQVLVELAEPDTEIIFAHDGAIVACRLDDLVPLGFSRKDLDAPR